MYRWFVTRAVPLRDLRGGIVQWFGTMTDIDDRKQRGEEDAFLADASAALAQLTDQESTLQKLASLAVPAFADWCAVDMHGTGRHHCGGWPSRTSIPAKVQLVRELDRKYPSRPRQAAGSGR